MIALTSAMALAAAAPVAAAQGTYDVVSCSAGGKPVPAGAWTSSFSGWAPVDQGSWPAPASDRCARNSGFSLDFSSMAATGPLKAAWTFSAPPGTSITSVSFNRRAAHTGLAFAATRPFAYALRSDGTVLESSPAQDSWLLDGERAFAGLHTTRVSAEMTCPQGQRCGGNPTAAMVIAASRVTLRDAHPPAFASPPGIDNGVVTARFADSGGGVRSAVLVVAGTAAESVDFCRAPYAQRIPCPRGGTATFRSRATTEPMRVELRDVAGNRTILAVPPSKTAAVEQPLPGPAAPASPPRGVVGVRGRRTVRARYDKPPLVRGTLKTPDGTPIGAARVGVTGTSGVLTDAQGRFRVRLPKGPSRSVTFSYGDAVQTVKVIVAAPIRLKVSPTTTRNGRSVKFSGSVPQAGKARTRVELQAWANGQWVPFRTVPLRNGRFSARYRFMRTFFEQRYRFRAVIQSDPDFPYAAGRSKEVRVLVRP